MINSIMDQVVGATLAVALNRAGASPAPTNVGVTLAVTRQLSSGRGKPSPYGAI